MSSLIDREDLLDSIYDITVSKKETWQTFLEKVINVIDESEVKAIQCKDCKFFKSKDSEFGEIYGVSGCFRAKELSKGYPIATIENGYCSWGDIEE